MSAATDEGLVMQLGKSQDVKPNRLGDVNDDRGQMGGRCQADEPSPPQVTSAPPPPPQASAPAVAEAADIATPEQAALLTKQLQGRWIDRNTPDVSIAEIRGAVLVWSEELQNDIKFLSGGRMSIVLEGEILTAMFEPGPDPCLIWSDGAVWSFDQLHGDWYNSADMSLIGQVRDGGNVYWDEKFCSLPSQIRRSPESPGKVLLSIDGTDAVGQLELGAQPQIRWEDGEVWVRKS